MKHSFMKKALLFALCSSIMPLSVNLATLQARIIPVPLTPNDDNTHGDSEPKRSPVSDVLPIVTYDDDTSILAFEATLGMVFTYEVVDASNSVVATGIVSLASGQTDILSLSSLSAGSYTLLIYIGEQAYEGIFEK